MLLLSDNILELLSMHHYYNMYLLGSFYLGMGRLGCLDLRRLHLSSFIFLCIFSVLLNMLGCSSIERRFSCMVHIIKQS